MCNKLIKTSFESRGKFDKKLHRNAFTCFVVAVVVVVAFVVADVVDIFNGWLGKKSPRARLFAFSPD